MKFLEMVGNLRYTKKFLRDKNVPKLQKFLFVFGVFYILSPIDLIPAPVLGFSILDDLSVFAFIVYYLRHSLAAYRGKDDNGNIYENASYMIADDEDDLPKQ